MNGRGGFICPTTPGPNEGDIIGCGARITVEVADDGTVDCPECGIDFPASEPGVRVNIDEAGYGRFEHIGETNE